MAKRIWLEPPATWEEEIRAFEAEDRSAPPAAGAIVFTGSSSIRMWTTLAQDMAPRPVLNRGFGGSQAHQVLHFAPRIVLPYHPAAVVLYTGENDLEGRTGKPPEQVLAEIAAFTDLLAQALPQTRLLLLSVKPSPARRQRWPLACRLNALLATFARDDPRRHWVDLAAPMFNDRGQRRRELFLADGLHLSTAGYALWTRVLRQQLGLDSSVSTQGAEPGTTIQPFFQDRAFPRLRHR
jgi:lysophospholipase L1-like esterase